MVGHEIRIVDDEFQTLPERHIGNLQFRGPSNMQGYYNNPRATQAVFHDGWIDSGDLAYMVNGEVYITGRRKDLIIKAGRNLYPAEIEEMVGNIPGVRQGCVIAFGITDAQRGTENLVIVAETREKNKVQREKITKNINEAMSVTLDILPDHVVLVAPRIVPKTSSGKLQRAACKKMYQEGQLGRMQMPTWMQISKVGHSVAAAKKYGCSGKDGKIYLFPLCHAAHCDNYRAFIFDCTDWLKSTRIQGL